MVKFDASFAWEFAATALIEKASRLARRGSDEAPDHLYHFTDCPGLIGVFEYKTLWASLATALNDPSEIGYGFDLTRSLLRDGTLAPRHLSLERMEKELTGRAAHARAYVVSFCETLSLAGQWLHYGRAGSGVAVGFRVTGLTQPPYSLYKIEYERDAQVALIKGIVERIDAAVEEVLLETAGVERPMLDPIAERIAIDQLWQALSTIKHPSFAAEREWRLIAYEAAGVSSAASTSAAGPTHFRSTAGRVVPFKKLVYATLPAFEVVLGSSCPMRPTDLGIEVLLEEKLGASLTVRTSDVPVRA